MNTSDFIEKIRVINNKLEDIVRFDDFQRAFKTLEYLDDLRRDNKLNLDSEIKNKFNYIYNVLSWVSLPLLEEDEIFGLFSHNFTLSLEIYDYDLKRKTKHFLLGISWIPGRDIVKEKIRNILNKNQERLTNSKLDGYSFPSVENWIKYYTSKNGLGKLSQLKIKEFFINDFQIKKLSPEDRNKVTKFFDFYEFLKRYSLSPEGYEGEIPVNDKYFKGYIKDGVLIKDSRPDPKIERILKSVQGDTSYGDGTLGIPKTEAEKEIDALSHEEEKYKEGSLERLALDEEIDKKRKIDDLQIEINKYKENSLERRALEDELSKLKAQ